MHILFMTSRLPYPPDRGDRLRTFNLIKHLSNDHEVTLVSFITHESERKYQAALQVYCQDIHLLRISFSRSVLSVLLNFWRREPLQALYYRSRSMGRLLGRIIAVSSFDVVYVHLFRMALYAADLSNLYRIVDLTDVISREVADSLPYRRLPASLLYTFEQQRIQQYERWITAHFEEVWLISDFERAALDGCQSRARVHVVPNGVDTEKLRPTGQTQEVDKLLFVGHMRVFHNVDAACYLAEIIFPQILQQVPGCSLTLTGTDPGPEVQRLSRHTNIKVTGFEPDLNACLNRATVFVAPLRFGAGVQNKILEAMSAGLPVVTTSIVNKGLGAKLGRDILIGDDAEEFTRHVVALLRNPRQRVAQGKAGRDFVRQHFNWKSARQRMRQVEASL